MTVDDVVQRLKETGCKLTPQRRMLVEVLVSSDPDGLTADAIFQRIRAVYPEVGLDTIYRNIRMLVKLNFVDELKWSGSLAHYALNRQMHQHGLICLDCGLEIALARCPIRELETIARSEYGFVIASHRIELFGYCADCDAHRQAP
jgi:Fe2+ or Zn2+ uptake regulation protein